MGFNPDSQATEAALGCQRPTVLCTGKVATNRSHALASECLQGQFGLLSVRTLVAAGKARLERHCRWLNPSLSPPQTRQKTKTPATRKFPSQICVSLQIQQQKTPECRFSAQMVNFHFND